ncbi:MAG: hypothetical protein Fur0041_22700 [Bacteroidia bacterium]
MKSTGLRPELIEKEQVAALRFPNGDVLTDNEEKNRRKSELERAMVLGNMDHNKVKIIFSDETGPKMIETTIWAVTQERIVLKSGMVIPIRRIHEIIT